MRTVVALVVMFAALSPGLVVCADPGPELALKQYHIGMPEKAARKGRFFGTYCEATRCVKQESFAGVNAQYVIEFSAKIVKTVTVTLAAEHFGLAVDALAGKYGAPELIDQGPVSNAMGATVDQQHYRWRRGDLELDALRVGTQLNESVIVLRSRQATEIEQDERQKRAASDI